MIACDEYMEKISRWLDADLTPDEQEELFEHLAHCPKCASALSEFEELRIMASENLPKPPRVLHDGVMNTVRAEKKRPWFARYRFTAVAAVFALVILGLSFTPLKEMLSPTPSAPLTVSEPDTQPVPSQNARILPSAPKAQEEVPVVDEPVDEINTKAKLSEEEPIEYAADTDTETDTQPMPEATPRDDDLEIDIIPLPETPFDRAFSSYLALSVPDAPEVLYEFVSDRTVEHTVYYIIPSERMADVQSALLSQGIDFVFTPADSAQTEALVMLTITHE